MNYHTNTNVEYREKVKLAYKISLQSGGWSSCIQKIVELEEDSRKRNNTFLLCSAIDQEFRCGFFGWRVFCINTD